MKSTFKFLKDLANHNEKAWFDANKKTYDTCKKEYTDLVAKIINQSAKFDPEIEGLEASKTLFRINRDVRFSKDKSPYKTNFGASINPGGKKSITPGYYLHIEPGKSFLAGGCWGPEPNVLAAIRQEIDYNWEEFTKIINHKDFKANFKKISEDDKLKNPPKGYDAENPMIEIIKNRHFVVVHNLTDAQVCDEKFSTYAAKVFKAMHPFNMFLREAIKH